MSTADLTDLVDDVEIPDEVLAHGESAVSIYLTSIGQGESAGWALMCALRSPPGLRGTDSINFAGTKSGNPFPNMPESLRQHYIKQCRKHGVSFEGKVYKTGLVRPGYGGLRMDPEALVDSTADVKKLIASRGWGCEGMVNVDAVEKDAPSAVLSDNYEVADDIVNERVEREVVENHGGRIKKKHLADLRAKVKEKLKGNH